MDTRESKRVTAMEKKSQNKQTCTAATAYLNVFMLHDAGTWTRKLTLLPLRKQHDAHVN